jgi:hypothetical protein
MCLCDYYYYYYCIPILSHIVRSLHFPTLLLIKYSPSLSRTLTPYFTLKKVIDHLILKGVWPTYPRDFLSLIHWRIVDDSILLVVVGFPPEDLSADVLQTYPKAMPQDGYDKNMKVFVSFFWIMYNSCQAMSLRNTLAEREMLILLFDVIWGSIFNICLHVHSILIN